MQMIVHYSLTDFDSFKAAFDRDDEDRRNNGLGLLQLWREDDSNAWALFTLHDAIKARAWLDGAAAVFNAQAGVTATSAHIVKTA